MELAEYDTTIPMPDVTEGALPPAEDPPATSTTGFSSLPGEIRNLIYHKLLDDSPEMLHCRNAADVLPPPDATNNRISMIDNLPSLAYSCRRSYCEILSLAVGRKQLVLTTSQEMNHLEAALQYGPARLGPHSPLNLNFNEFSTIGCSPPRAQDVMDFCTFATSLEHLTLCFDAFHLDRLVSASTLAADYRLTDLTQMVNLKTIEIQCRFGDYYNPRRPALMLQGLATWAERKLQEILVGAEIDQTAMVRGDRVEPEGFRINIRR